VHPVCRTLGLLLWFLPAFTLPLAIALFARESAAAALQWLLSLDLPLFLLLTTLICRETISRAARKTEYRWLAPATQSRPVRSMLAAAGLMHATRWPAALLLAGSLLASGSGNNRAALVELLWLCAAAPVMGAALGRLLMRRPGGAAEEPRRRATRVHGLAVLSYVPLWETRRQVDPRQLALIAMPVLLAAPMGVVAGKVAMALAAWIPLAYAEAAMREAGRTVAAIRRWMPQSALQPLQLQWFVRRLVAVAWLAGGIALWAGWQVLA
jgi:hypothetical protein